MSRRWEDQEAEAAKDDYLRDHDDRPTRSDLAQTKAEDSTPAPVADGDPWFARIREGSKHMQQDRARTAPPPSTHRIKVGDGLIITVDGQEYLMFVTRKDPTESAGRARSAGPRIHASVMPGGYTVDFDDHTTHITWRKP